MIFIHLYLGEEGEKNLKFKFDGINGEIKSRNSIFAVWCSMFAIPTFTKFFSLQHWPMARSSQYLRPLVFKFFCVLPNQKGFDGRKLGSVDICPLHNSKLLPL